MHSRGRALAGDHARERQLRAGGLLLFVAALLLLPSVSAANDPGHDTLYLEQSGEQNLTGSFNVSAWLRVANLIFSEYLDVLGNGSDPGFSKPAVYGKAGNSLYLDAPGNIYFQTGGGSGTMVSIGTSGVDLNVSRDLYVEDDLIIAGTQRIDQAGVGSFATGTTIDSKNVCLTDGTNCPSAEGTSSAGGWTNTSTMTKTSRIVNVTNATTGDHVFYVDTETKKVGVGTDTPTYTFDVTGDVRTTGSLYANIVTSATDANLNLYGSGSTGAAGYGVVASYYNGSDWLEASRTNNVASGYGDMILMKDGGNVGVGTAEPNSTLHVYDGFINVSGSGADVCVDGVGCLSDAGSGDGNVSGSGTATYVPYWVDGSETLDDSNALFDGTNFDVASGNLEVGGTTRISSAGVGTFATGTTIDSKNVCLADGTNCQAASSAGGWTNTSAQTKTSRIVNVTNATTGNHVLYVDTESEKIGVGTSSSDAQLQLYQNSASWDDALHIYVTGANPSEAKPFIKWDSAWGPVNGYIAGSSDGSWWHTQLSGEQGVSLADNGTDILTVRSDNVGVGTTEPNASLHVYGGIINVSGVGADVCVDGTGCLSDISSGDDAGGWTNTSTMTQTSLIVNVTNETTGNHVLYVDTESERVGIGTSEPENVLDVRDAGTGAYFEREYAGDANTIRGALTVARSYSGGAGANGIGSQLGFNAETTTEGTMAVLGIIGAGATDATNGAIDSYLRFWVYDGGTGADKMVIKGTGAVGINNSNPTSALDVHGSINVSGPGNIYYEGDLTGYGADLAELVFAAEPLGPGDVVVISDAGDETVERSSLPYDARVAGIVSTDPSHLISADEGDVPLALAGRVPVKVTAQNGPIRRGDLLTTSSTPGHAMRCPDRFTCAGAIVGKALEPLDDASGTITALVMLG